MKTDNVNFGAVPINSIKIKKYNKLSKQFVDYSVNFVRLEANYREDLAAIDKVTQKWKDAKYVQQIATATKWMNSNQIKVYALTSQQTKFDKLQADKILGLAEMRVDEDNPKYMALCHLQVRPNAINVNQKNKVNYKHIGSSILTSLKKIYSRISLCADKDKNIELFYKYNGFVDDFKGSRDYKWAENPIEKLLLRLNKFRRETGLWLFV